MGYITIQNSTSSKKYLLSSTTSFHNFGKAYMKIGTGYLPLTTQTSTGLQFQISRGNKVYQGVQLSKSYITIEDDYRVEQRNSYMNYILDIYENCPVQVEYTSSHTTTMETLGIPITYTNYENRIAETFTRTCTSFSSTLSNGSTSSKSKTETIRYYDNAKSYNGTTTFFSESYSYSNSGTYGGINSTYFNSRSTRTEYYYAPVSTELVANSQTKYVQNQTLKYYWTSSYMSSYEDGSTRESVETVTQEVIYRDNLKISMRTE